VLTVMERAADWQLAHPVSFDVFSERPEVGGWELTRISWEGTVLSRRPCAVRPDPAGLPEPWLRLARLERDDVSFSEMPAAVQAAWLQETGLSASLVTLIQMHDGSTRGWEMGVLYHGLLALEALSPKPVYGAALRHLAQANAWRLGERIHHADDHVVGYLYLALYERERVPEQLAGVQSRFDWILRHPPTHRMDIGAGQERWTWCDALFMSPPVWARLARLTGDPAYLAHLDREWWATTGHLYSPRENLFFRDASFLARREANGAPVFWSRGNGWVLAGLARVLDELPADAPSRGRYVELFQAMAGRIAPLQHEDGLWRSSLLDPAAYPEPEVSSSAFFCYALAWGINRGLLPADTVQPAVLRAWSALAARVGPEGHLGYIQLPSARPGSATAQATAPYGVGAFLLAGAEVHQLLQRD
jgi:rhamnogalacturonyl hydrolase YesR